MSVRQKIKPSAIFKGIIAGFILYPQLRSRLKRQKSKSASLIPLIRNSAPSAGQKRSGMTYVRIVNYLGLKAEA